ncbi:putative rAsp f 9 allergen [Fusarium austroafricanum]|uniref:Putative rAsp f 9 allergen n=1 Tax=Fusarium austroafricanum TaxID=2364996 RepID=A0A8H4NWN5_9HYPO|nr:putative rAsp f 9 allergen [Fusarium austroafricanum]
MFSKAIVALALAAPTLVSAQTFTKCNPMTQTCPADPAFGKDTVHCDFTKGPCSAFAEEAGTGIKHTGNGAVFTISGAGQAPTIATGKYLFFGRVDVEVQASTGVGICTSAVLQSNNLDEIDWEWLGGDNAQVQSNYFSKGDVSTYDRGAFHPVANPTGQFHTYSIEWVPTHINWMIDNTVVRTLKYADAKGGSAFPQTPMQVKLGTWTAGSPSAAPGTIQWAGGLADYSKGPFNAYYKSISIIDYAGGNAPTTKSVREYIYGGNSGSYESIQIR